MALLGKVTVIKTFELTKLMYPYKFLGNPSGKLITDINI